jgi:hypothetical protein
MTAQERIEAHLRKHEGLFLCASCLGHEIGVSPPEARSIVWTLQAFPGFEMRGAKCVVCQRGKRAIRYTGGQNVVGAPAEVILFLLSTRDIYRCLACVAFAVEVSLAEVRGVVAYISPLPEFDRREGRCTVCGRETRIIAARSFDEATSDRLTQIVTGSVQYHGWRIDLLSYRVLDGWRPFVIIKSATLSMVADAPSVMWGVASSKAEADAEALQAAKDWIDKRGG